MERRDNLDFLRVTEAAALSSAPWVGKGDRNSADQAACDGMRSALNELGDQRHHRHRRGRTRRSADAVHRREVGTGKGPNVQIAVDPLEGTNLCANGTPNAISFLAAVIEGEGKLMHAPDCYMDKIVVGPECIGVIDITVPARINVRLMAKALGKGMDELTDRCA